MMVMTMMMEGEVQKKRIIVGFKGLERTKKENKEVVTVMIKSM